jgi:hypothetical protein
MGERIFIKEPDLNSKLAFIGGHELTQAFSAFLRLPLWLDGGIEMVIRRKPSRRFPQNCARPHKATPCSNNLLTDDRFLVVVQFAFDRAPGIVPRSNWFQSGLSKLTYFNSANIRLASTACVPVKFKSKARWREVLLSARFLR